MTQSRQGGKTIELFFSFGSNQRIENKRMSFALLALLGALRRSFELATLVENDPN